MTPRRRAWVWLSLSLLALLAGAGCGSCGGTSPQGSGARSEPPEEHLELPPFPVATIRGVVSLKDKAQLPVYPMEKPEELPEGLPNACAPVVGAEVRPLKLGSERTLQGVMVTVSGPEQWPERPPVDHRLTIRNCRLTPSFISATKGDRLIIENKTDYPFLPTLGREPFMQAVLHNQSRTFPLDRGGVQAVRCGFAAPCGRADVVVNYHPVYAVTDSRGRFELNEVPAGQQVRIHAWHPLLEEHLQWVDAHEKKPTEVRLNVKPARPGEPNARDLPREAPGP